MYSISVTGTNNMTSLKGGLEMKIDKESKIPLYHQLYEAIARTLNREFLMKMKSYHLNVSYAIHWALVVLRCDKPCLN